jgi:hypothetical protein
MIRVHSSAITVLLTSQMSFFLTLAYTALLCCVVDLQECSLLEVSNKRHMVIYLW